MPVKPGAFYRATIVQARADRSPQKMRDAEDELMRWLG